MDAFAFLRERPLFYFAVKVLTKLHFNFSHELQDEIERMTKENKCLIGENQPLSEEPDYFKKEACVFLVSTLKSK